MTEHSHRPLPALAEEYLPQSYMDLVAECLSEVEELFPWDLSEELQQGRQPLILDIREPYEFAALHLPGSLNVPRGVLEPACEWGYEETVPELVQARERDIVVVCRSGYRSVLAAYTLRRMGYQHVRSLKTGVRGWNDYEQPLVDGKEQPLELEQADAYFMAGPRPDQLKPRRA